MRDSQAAINRGDERVGRDRFPQHTVKIGYTKVARVGASDHDDRNMASLRARGEFALDVVSREAWKRQIEHDQARDATVDIPQSVDTVFNSDYRVSSGYERGPIQLAQGMIIFDDQEGRLPRRREHERMVKEFVPSQKLSGS